VTSGKAKTESGVQEKQDEQGQISAEEALKIGINAHRHGELDLAEEVYRRVLATVPTYADAMHFLGVVLHQRSQSDEALALIKRSIELAPDIADWHSNLGNVWVERGDAREALKAYDRALELQPGNSRVHNNRGAARNALGDFNGALDEYRRAIELDPEFVDGYMNVGNLLFRQGKTTESVRFYDEALKRNPNHYNARRMVGIAFSMQGDNEAAAEIYRRWLADEPDNPVARHLLAACSGENVPDRASDELVQQLFDPFADSFDGKLEKLDYRAPQLAVDAVRRALSEPDKSLICLDAGCGTGLCGSLLEPYSRQLVGVDLSGRMLERARIRSCYDDLVKAELTQFLLDSERRFDLIVSADTLVYFGRLDKVLRAARAALRPGGLFVFTVEKLTEVDSAEFRLNHHGRYSHSAAYLAAVLAEAGFEQRSIEPGVLRKEAQVPVDGFVVSAR
jgi:predicted TPR repeat methyltransferase